MNGWRAGVPGIITDENGICCPADIDDGVRGPGRGTKRKVISVDDQPVRITGLRASRRLRVSARINLNGVELRSLPQCVLNSQAGLAGIQAVIAGVVAGSCNMPDQSVDLVVVNDIAAVDVAGGVKQQHLIAFKGVAANDDGSRIVIPIPEFDADSVAGDGVIEDIGILRMVTGADITEYDAAVFVVNQMIAVDQGSLHIGLKEHAIGHAADVVVANGVVERAAPARVGTGPVLSGDDQYAIVGTADGVALHQGIV